MPDSFAAPAASLARRLSRRLARGRTPEELRNALATVARSHGISDLARRSGVSRPGIYKALGQDGNPSFGTIRSIPSAMGLRLTVEPAEVAA
jgi:probable addiction module antidote protein